MIQGVAQDANARRYDLLFPSQDVIQNDAKSGLTWECSESQIQTRDTPCHSIEPWGFSNSLCAESYS